MAEILILAKKAVIPAGMPESSHKDVKLRAGTLPESNICVIGELPSKDGKLGATTDVPAIANKKLRVGTLPKSSI